MLHRLALPRLRSLPLLYRWRIRQQIYRWYAALDAVDRALGDALPAEQIARLVHTLEWVEGEVRQAVVPPRTGRSSIICGCTSSSFVRR